MRWIRSRTAVVALVVTGVAALSIALGMWHSWPAQAQPDLIVNDDNDPAVDGCDSPDYSTIQLAVDHSSGGETIMVCEGTYDGGVTVNESVTIEGREGADRADVVIEVDAPTPADGLTIEADNVTIRHLTLDGPGASNVGILVPAVGPPGYEHVTINDVEATEWSQGIQTNDAVDLVIEDCYVHDNEDEGVFMMNGTGNVLRGSHITSNGWRGLVVVEEDELVVEGNTLSGNVSAQVLIAGPRVNMRIVRNDIVTAPDSTGITIPGASAEAFIQIGGSPEHANSFSGPFDPLNYPYLVHACSAENTVDATYNWWGTIHRIDNANRISNDEDDDTGTECALPHDGSVVFHPWATEPAPTPSPSPTPTPTPSPTPSPTPVAATRDFDLQLGWNNFGWSGADATAADTVLSCIAGNFAIAYGLEAGGWLRYVPGQPDITTLATVDKYDTLLVLVTASGVQCLGMPVEP